MKERLTGAIILVALIVLLVPELLTGPIRIRSVPVASAIAARGNAPTTARAQPPLRSYTLTLGGASPAHEAAATPAAPVQTQPAASSAQTPTASPSPTESPAQSDEPQQAATPHEPASNADSSRLPAQSSKADSGLQAAKLPAHPSTGWVVQLGSFASRQNADRLAHLLAGRGFRMSVSPAQAGPRELWRVRAGPVHDRASAQRLAARLRALGHRGELLPVR